MRHVATCTSKPGGPMKLQNASDSRVSMPLSRPSIHICLPTNRSQISTCGHSSATKFDISNSFCIPASCDRDGSNTSLKISTWSKAPSWAAATATMRRWTNASVTMGTIGPIIFLVMSASGRPMMRSQRNCGAKVSKDTPASIISWAERPTLVEVETFGLVIAVIGEILLLPSPPGDKGAVGSRCDLPLRHPNRGDEGCWTKPCDVLATIAPTSNGRRARAIRLIVINISVPCVVLTVLTYSELCRVSGSFRRLSTSHVRAE
mmetsp:Transcript_28033/g.81036  ORF Transcript_28033/g.81036 Transcript_28033/m.81036 type:complete len:262 (+) Transcript_28033:156-941(+)